VPEPDDDDSAEIEIVMGIIKSWFEGLGDEDVEDCAGEIVEALRLRRGGSGMSDG
jgi:hypothetical protein